MLLLQNDHLGLLNINYFDIKSNLKTYSITYTNEKLLMH